MSRLAEKQAVVTGGAQGLGEAICLRLAGAHPDAGNRSAEQCAETVKERN